MGVSKKIKVFVFDTLGDHVKTYYTAKAAAEGLGISPAMIQYYLNNGRLVNDSFYLSRRLKFTPPGVLKKFIKQVRGIKYRNSEREKQRLTDNYNNLF